MVLVNLHHPTLILEALQVQVEKRIPIFRVELILELPYSAQVERPLDTTEVPDLPSNLDRFLRNPSKEWDCYSY